MKAILKLALMGFQPVRHPNITVGAGREPPPARPL